MPRITFISLVHYDAGQTEVTLAIDTVKYTYRVPEHLGNYIINLVRHAPMKALNTLKKHGEYIRKENGIVK